MRNALVTPIRPAAAAILMVLPMSASVRVKRDWK